MARPLVSILTPTYNHERFIGPCIESVLRQSMPDWEMVVVDDGSTDRTAEIAESYDDPRIRVIRQENRGLADLRGTYNLALAETGGPLVAILEGDDLWPPNKLESQVSELEDEAAALSFGAFAVVDEEGRHQGAAQVVLPPTDCRENRPVGRAALAVCDPHYMTFAFPVTLVIRRAALEKIGGFQQTPELPLVDYPTLLALTRAGEWRFTDAVMGYWRRHGESTTHQRTPSILTGALKCSGRFMAESAGDLPVSASEWSAVRLRRRAFQHERALLAHRWALSLGDRARAGEFLNAAGRMAVGRVAKARVAAARLMFALGRSTEPVLSLKRGPWQEMVKINDYDTLVSPEMPVADLLID